MHRLLSLFIAVTALLPLRTTAEENFIVPDCYQGFTLAHSGVQGMDIWGDYLVSLQNYGTCNVYKINSINSATKLKTFRLAS